MYVLCFTASFRFDGLFRVSIAIFLLEKVSWFFECIKVRATSMTPPTKWWFLSIDRSSTKWWFPSYLALRILLNCSRSTKEHFTLPRSRETSFSPRTWQRRSHEQNSKSARAFETFLHFLAVLCKSSTSTLQNVLNRCLPADCRWVIMLNLRHLGGHYSGIIIYWMYTLWLHRCFEKSERRETLLAQLYFTLYC